MARIEIPRRASVNQSAQLIRRCNEAEREREPVELDARSTDLLTPFGIALVASCILVRRLEGRQTTLLVPEDADLAEPFVQAELAELASGKSPAPTGGLCQITGAPGADLDQKLAAEVERMLGLPADQAEPVLLCLRELVNNALGCSGSPVGALFTARRHAKTRAVRLAVLDRGSGVPAGLRRKQIHNLHRATDSDVIEAAVVDSSLSSRDDDSAGKGLMRVLETVRSHQGRLTLLSYGAKVAWAGERVTKSISPPLRGTAVELDLCLPALLKGDSKEPPPLADSEEPPPTNSEEPPPADSQEPPP